MRVLASQILETLVQIREQMKITNARLASIERAGERKDFAEILKRLRQRGVITDADIERLSSTNELTK